MLFSVFCTRILVKNNQQTVSDGLRGPQHIISQPRTEEQPGRGHHRCTKPHKCQECPEMQKKCLLMVFVPEHWSETTMVGGDPAVPENYKYVFQNPEDSTFP